MKFNISKMLKPEVYDHPVRSIEFIETHISWVVLTGDFAYKIKKTVNFGFLDFSTLEKRREYCERELELNSRLAPEIYLEVVPVYFTNGTYSVIGTGSEIIEYAVKMKQFSQSFQLDHMLEHGALALDHMDAIARMVADFHQSIPVAGEAVEYGRSNLVYQPVEENFIQIREHIYTESYTDILNLLETWCHSKFESLNKAFQQRKQGGFIRECHGDMHLRNLIWLNDKPMAFDCIEFNDRLRWIDVISEVAFLLMDLQDRKQYLLANRFINGYLELTGDYSGLQVLDFYLCYRALVRAKVDALRLEQERSAGEGEQRVVEEFESYLELAKGYTRESRPKIIVMRGMSASGKSTVSQQLVDKLGMIRVRSDVERKRLFNKPLMQNASTGIDTGIYSAEASRQTYSKLLELASVIINAGYSVILDAVFMRHEHIVPFQQLANTTSANYFVLEVKAPVEILKQRIMERDNDVSDADLAVLEHQVANWGLLPEDEMDHVITMDTTDTYNIDGIIDNFITS